MSQEKEEPQVEECSSTNDIIIIRDSEEDDVIKEELLIEDADSTINEIAIDNHEDSRGIKKDDDKNEVEPFTLCLVDEEGSVLETYVRINDEMVRLKETSQAGPPPVKKCKGRPAKEVKRKGRPAKVVSRRALLKKKLSRQKVNEEVFCEHCNVGFKGMKEFSRHLRKQHINVYDHGYICCHCGYQVGPLQFGHISRHLKQIHCCKSNRRHSCEKCGLKFFETKDLIRHMNVHTPHGPFECAYCNFSHTCKSVLSMHLKKHQLLNEPNKINPKVFTDDPYQCYHCGYKTFYKACLSQHIDRHLGIRRYKCSKCDYSTYCKGDLIKHNSSHSKLRAYGCDVCSKTYKRRSHLMAHIDLKHSNPIKV